MRLRILTLIISILFVILIIGLWYTQFARGSYYYNLSEKNRLRIVPINGPRGIIYDRKGEILADNRLSFDVVIVPQEVKDKDKTLKALANKLNIPYTTLSNSFDKQYKKGRSFPFAPVVLAKGISKDNAIILEENKLNLPGIVVQANPDRTYLYGKDTAHLLGYIGEIHEEQLKRLKDYGYKGKDIIGHSGLEKFFDNTLRGKDGGMLVEVDNRGRQIRVIGSREPAKGMDIHLTIDIGLQKFISQLLHGRRGGAVFMDPDNGAIFALVSSPSFDPEIFMNTERRNELKDALRDKYNLPLLNRSVMSSYPPGSIFKIITAAAALKTRKITPHTTFHCDGQFHLGNATFACNSTHGNEDILGAVEHSCNVFFYNTGLKVGVDGIAKYALDFGLGEVTGVELPGENSGHVPDRTWKMLKRGENWYPGDTVNLSIGQGSMLITPLQGARMVSVIANGGYLVTPHLINGEGRYQGNTGVKRVDISDEVLKIIKDGMRRVVEGDDGTGRRARIDGLNIAAKTGTAEVSSGKSHAWFCGFAPINNPRVAFAIFLEHGGKGGEDAADIAKDALEFIRGNTDLLR